MDSPGGSDGKEPAYNAGYSSYLENAYAGDLSLVGAAKLNLFSFTVLCVELDLMESFVLKTLCASGFKDYTLITFGTLFYIG